VPYLTRHVAHHGWDVLLVEDSGRGSRTGGPAPRTAHGLLRVKLAGAGASPEVPPSAERDAFLRAVAADPVGTTGAACRGLTVFAVAVANTARAERGAGLRARDACSRPSPTPAHRAPAARPLRALCRQPARRGAAGLPGRTAGLAAERLQRLVAAEPIETGEGAATVSPAIGAASAPAHAHEGGRSCAGRKGAWRSPRSVPAPFRAVRTRRRSGPAASPADRRCARLRRDPERTPHRDRLPAHRPRRHALRRLEEALLRVEGPTAGDSGRGRDPAFERTGWCRWPTPGCWSSQPNAIAASPGLYPSLNVSPLTLDTPDWLPTLAAHLGCPPRDRGPAHRGGDRNGRDPRPARHPAFAGGHEGARRPRSPSTISAPAIPRSATCATFPVDYLKLDGAFVQNVAGSERRLFRAHPPRPRPPSRGRDGGEWVGMRGGGSDAGRWGADYLQGDHAACPSSCPARLPRRTRRDGRPRRISADKARRAVGRWPGGRPKLGLVKAARFR
jgi:hypothetical protein